MSGFVVWFTGLSGSGKSTLAAMLAAELRHRGVHVESLDGDEVRTHLSKGLGFSREDRDTNVRRIGFVARLLARSGACAITAAISPYRAVRDEQRRQVERFVEVYTRCSLPVLAERDPKGLYKKALAGEIKGFTGVDDPYEAPEQAEVVVDTGVETTEESLGKILATLEALGLVPALAGRRPRPRERAGRALVAPHGGELVDRFARGPERDALAERAKGLVAVDLDARAESDVEMIATGAFSPLQGFLGSKDYLRVLGDLRLENGLLWPVPITLAIPAALADRIAVGADVALRARDGRLVAVLDVADKWAPDLALEARAIGEAPSPARPVYLGGALRALERAAAPGFPRHHRDPRHTRALFAERGWSRVVGFHAEGPMHRGHEHVTKAALESCDGLLVHQVAEAAASPDEIPVEVRLRADEALLAGYYPAERTLLSIYPGVTRHAGPREALLHALTRKSYGCSHVLVGPDPEARRLFDGLAPGELGVQPLYFERPFYSSIVGGMATVRTAPGDTSTRLEISSADLRARLLRGETPPPELLRPEVARILVEAMRER